MAIVLAEKKDKHEDLTDKWNETLKSCYRYVQFQLTIYANFAVRADFNIQTKRNLFSSILKTVRFTINIFRDIVKHRSQNFNQLIQCLHINKNSSLEMRNLLKC